MHYTIRPAYSARQLALVSKLDRILFPGDTPIDIGRSEHWLVWAQREAIAFSSVRILHNDPGSALRDRSGVLTAHRGRGLQRRLIRHSQRWAADIGMICVLATTTISNYHSSINFFRCGFRTFEPAALWMAKNTIYWKWKPEWPTNVR